MIVVSLLYLQNRFGDVPCFQPEKIPRCSVPNIYVNKTFREGMTCIEYHHISLPFKNHFLFQERSRWFNRYHSTAIISISVHGYGQGTTMLPQVRSSETWDFIQSGRSSSSPWQGTTRIHYAVWSKVCVHVFGYRISIQNVSSTSLILMVLQTPLTMGSKITIAGEKMRR